jgi:hypothetical protein
LNTWHRVPEDWDFPRCGIRDLWRQWWIGDTRRQIPPLRHIDTKDVNHIDKRPIGENEQHGRRGKFKEKRRAAVKIISDMKFAMNYIRRKIEAKKLWFKRNEPITQRKINNMFASVNDEFLINGRDVQKSWLTVVRDLRNVLRKRGELSDTDSESDDE